jgi:hypothetical protein
MPGTFSSDEKRARHPSRVLSKVRGTGLEDVPAFINPRPCWAHRMSQSSKASTPRGASYLTGCPCPLSISFRAPPRRFAAHTLGMTLIWRPSMIGMRARRAHHTLPAHLLRFALGSCGAGVPPARGRSGFVIWSERVEGSPNGAWVDPTLYGRSRPERPSNPGEFIRLGRKPSLRMTRWCAFRGRRESRMRSRAVASRSPGSDSPFRSAMTKPLSPNV